jgi:hypothetical protein
MVECENFTVEEKEKILFDTMFFSIFPETI